MRPPETRCRDTPCPGCGVQWQLRLAGSASALYCFIPITFPSATGRGESAMTSLSSDEIAAVIADKRAHAAGRHDLLIDAARLLATAYPRVGVFAATREHLARLIELRADDIAAAPRNPPSLARALVTMASETANMAAPSALAATGGDAMQRLDRAAHPRHHL